MPVLNASPKVSVIVPVRNRRELLRKLLDALTHQTFADFEIIVIDDDSSDGSAEVTEEYAGRGVPVKVIRGGGGGAVAAREAGVAAAQGEFLAFTDSDCVPSPRWLEAGVRALEAGADLVQGETLPSGPVGPLHRSMTVTRQDGLYPTCNIFYRRSSYEAAGGFDLEATDRFLLRSQFARRLGIGEDTLLGWRVRRSGKTTFLPEAFVQHHVFRPDVLDSLKRGWMVKAFPILVREIPELRDTLLHHRFLLGRRRIWLLVALIAVIGRRKGLAGAALGIWAASRLREAGFNEPSLSKRVAALPFDLAVEAVSETALVFGSARAKSLVL